MATVTDTRPRRLLGLLPPAPEPILIDGHPIKGRFAQQILWSIGLGTLIFGLFASGLYFGGSQVHWYIHLGGFYWPGFWLKHGWDGGMGLVGQHTWLINQANWPFYRHAYRDIGLPALATMGALSIAGGARKPAGRLYTAIAPVLVLVAAVVLITFGMWLQLKVNAHLTAGQGTNLIHLGEALLLGVLIGKVLHYIWRPAGTRIQRFLVERLVDRHFRHGGHGLPSWVRYPDAPPTARECAVQIVAEDEASGEAGRLRAQGHTARSQVVYWLAAVAVVVILGVDFIGFIGHVWVAILHHTFPYLAPKG